jgi:hypothetical protein
MSRWFSTMTLSGMLVAYTSVAFADQQNCKVVKDRDTFDAIMQGLPAAGAVVMMVAPGEVRWGKVALKVAAALGLSNTVWNAAKSYFGGDQGFGVCVNHPIDSSALRSWSSRTAAITSSDTPSAAAQRTSFG